MVYYHYLRMLWFSVLVLPVCVFLMVFYGLLLGLLCFCMVYYELGSSYAIPPHPTARLRLAGPESPAASCKSQISAACSEFHP